jgi:hypothetical protein
VVLLDELRELREAAVRMPQSRRDFFEATWHNRITLEDEGAKDLGSRSVIRARRADELPDVLREAARSGLEELLIIDGWDVYRTYTGNVTLDDLNPWDRMVWAVAEDGGLEITGCILQLGQASPMGKLMVKVSWKQQNEAPPPN